MRFVVDAQLPRLLADHLSAIGHDAIHVKQLPKAGETSDAEISAFADIENRIVITKDADFLESHLLGGTPRQLLRVATGNITNTDLITIFDRVSSMLEEAFADADKWLSRQLASRPTRDDPLNESRETPPAGADRRLQLPAQRRRTVLSGVNASNAGLRIHAFDRDFPKSFPTELGATENPWKPRGPNGI